MTTFQCLNYQLIASREFMPQINERLVESKCLHLALFHLQIDNTGILETNDLESASFHIFKQECL